MWVGLSQRSIQVPVGTQPASAPDLRHHMAMYGENALKWYRFFVRVLKGVCVCVCYL